jgi:hypothetical protein
MNSSTQRPHFTKDSLTSPTTSRRRPIVLTARKRQLLHRLLHRELSRCTSTSLASFQQAGWTHGPGGGHQLTEVGRRLAEISELSDREMELEVSLT